MANAAKIDQISAASGRGLKDIEGSTDGFYCSEKRPGEVVRIPDLADSAASRGYTLGDEETLCFKADGTPIIYERYDRFKV